MKKRKPYYIIIAVMCFASIINIFLPFLKLPDSTLGEAGNVLDYKVSVMNSHVIDRIAKENHMKKSFVYKVAKDINRGKDPADIAADLDPNQTYIVDIVSSEIDNKVAELEKVKGLDKTDFSYTGLIKISASIIKNLEQNIIDSSIVIFCLIFTVLSPLFVGLYMLITKAKKGYRLVKIISFTNILLAALSMISANAISIGALQVKSFYKESWGIGFFAILLLNAAIWLMAMIATTHEKFQGYVSWKIILKQRQLIIMSLPFVIYALIFYYGPLVGWTMAFQKF
ncbi:MAG TPA: hypothetical protein VN131_07855, partial [Mobilitalea sp.]|nr:hypothetical protein [Mobilitalea sp.]